MNILIFGGTTEGKKLCSYFESKQIHCFVSVATEYGKEVLPRYKYCDVICGRMEQQDMQSFIIQHHITLIIDATHPYAVLVSENIKKAAESEHVKYVRIIRQANESVPGVVYFDDIEGVITYINQKPAKTLVTTGSKELAAFTKVDCYQKNIYARVLPIETIRKQCIANGFDQEHIIGKQGPFSVEENMEQITQSGAEYLVTKDTGIEGGFPQKCLAAQQMGIQLLVIKRQGKESGITVEQLQDFMDRGGIWEEL